MRSFSHKILGNILRTPFKNQIFKSDIFKGIKERKFWDEGLANSKRNWKSEEGTFF